MLQQVSGEHCDILGYGMDKIGPQNLIWVVVRQKLELSSYPQAGEELLIETWPGPTRHGLFPRHYEIYASNGELIGTACALWTLVDVESRRMIKPEDYGVELQGITTGREKGNINFAIFNVFFVKFNNRMWFSHKVNNFTCRFFRCE